MTDTDTDSSDGPSELTASAAELFGPIERGSLEDESPARTDGDSRGGSRSDEPTAADLFSELQREAADDDDELLMDETPEEIIASADEPAADEQPADDDLLADTAAVEELLLTERREGEEFLWIDSGDSDDGSRRSAATEPERDADIESPIETDRDGPPADEIDEDAERPAAVRDGDGSSEDGRTAAVGAGTTPDPERGPVVGEDESDDSGSETGVIAPSVADSDPESGDVGDGSEPADSRSGPVGDPAESNECDESATESRSSLFGRLRALLRSIF